MRIFTNARGVPPKLRATTIRAFAPDKDYSSFGGIKDLLSTKELGFASTPTTTADCPVSGARVFDGTNYAYDSAASGDHASLTGECTWQAWVYIDSVQVKNSAYAFSYSASSETSATNIMLSIKVASSGGTPATLRSFWEYGSGSNQEAQSEQKPPTDEWRFLITAARATSTPRADPVLGGPMGTYTAQLAIILRAVLALPRRALRP